MSKPLEIVAGSGSPDTASPEARITLEGFRELLDRLHPFAAVLGIEILDIQYGQATLRLPPSPANQRLGGIVAGPMLMGVLWREEFIPIGAEPVDFQALARQHAEALMTGMLMRKVA